MQALTIQLYWQLFESTVRRLVRRFVARFCILFVQWEDLWDDESGCVDDYGKYGTGFCDHQKFISLFPSKNDLKALAAILNILRPHDSLVHIRSQLLTNWNWFSGSGFTRWHTYFPFLWDLFPFPWVCSVPVIIMCRYFFFRFFSYLFGSALNNSPKFDRNCMNVTGTHI